MGVVSKRAAVEGTGTTPENKLLSALWPSRQDMGNARNVRRFRLVTSLARRPKTSILECEGQGRRNQTGFTVLRPWRRLSIASLPRTRDESRPTFANQQQCADENKVSCAPHTFYDIARFDRRKHRKIWGVCSRLDIEGYDRC